MNGAKEVSKYGKKWIDVESPRNIMHFSKITYFLLNMKWVLKVGFVENMVQMSYSILCLGDCIRSNSNSESRDLEK